MALRLHSFRFMIFTWSTQTFPSFPWRKCGSRGPGDTRSSSKGLPRHDSAPKIPQDNASLEKVLLVASLSCSRHVLHTLRPRQHKNHARQLSRAQIQQNNAQNRCIMCIQSSSTSPSCNIRAAVLASGMFISR